MKPTLIIASLILSLNAFGEQPASLFLRLLYGDTNVVASSICNPNDDNWMIAGATDTNALAQVSAQTFHSKGMDHGLIQTSHGNDAYFVVTTNGKIDTRYNLDGVYQVQRKIIQMALYGALRQDQDMLGHIMSNPANVVIDGPKAAGGDMDVYADVIQTTPIIRISKAQDDAKTQSITYQLPIGDKGLSFTLIKVEGAWKIDSSKKLKIPLQFFFE